MNNEDVLTTVTVSFRHIMSRKIKEEGSKKRKEERRSWIKKRIQKTGTEAVGATVVHGICFVSAEHDTHTHAYILCVFIQHSATRTHAHRCV